MGKKTILYYYKNVLYSKGDVKMQLSTVGVKCTKYSMSNYNFFIFNIDIFIISTTYLPC